MSNKFVKKCLLNAASELCTSKKSVFWEYRSVTNDTGQQRVTDISNNLNN
jgi:hypothetical protein